ncbi:MAG: hypothetical protein ACFB0D_20310 [Phormidesmis sp.]
MKIRRLFILGLLLFGLYARFADVGQKVYTVDEVRGILRASGVTSQEFIDTVYTGEPLTNSDLQKYQTASVDRPLGAAMSAFANNPEHPPLYYLLMRFSLQIFSTAAASRWLAIAFSILLLPATYWLCQILFASTAVNANAVGWSTVALIAISPFHVLLAQEARQYTIWALLAVVSSAFLLQALQINRGPEPTTSAQMVSTDPHSKNTWLPWLGYGIAATLGMYSHLFFTWVLVTHGLYVLLSEKFRISQKLLRYLVTSTGISIAFSPWVWVVLSRKDQLGRTTKWASTYNSSLLERVEHWLHNAGIGFIDFDWVPGFSNPISYLILGAIAYSTYQLYRHTPKKVWLFIILLMAVSSLAHVIPDVLTGGRRSLLPRYSLIAYLGIEIAVGYAIAQAFNTHKKSQGEKPKQATLKQFAAITLILGSLVSSYLVSQSLGWGKGSSTRTLAATPLINQVTAPLILTDADHTYILSLSHQIPLGTQFILLDPEQTPDYTTALSQIPINRDFFIYSASNDLVEFLQIAPEITLTPQSREMQSAQLYQAQRRS